MKRFGAPATLALCALFVAAAVAACGGGDGAVGGGGAGLSADVGAGAGASGDYAPAEDAVGDGTTATVVPFSFEADMGVFVDGTWFPIWTDSAALLSALGDDYELYSAPSCVFDEGDDKEFAFDGYFLYTNPYDGKDIWYSFYLENDAFATARGVRVGDSLDDVFAAYGDGYYWEGESILTYSVSGIEGDIASPNVQFTVNVGRVTAIEIYYPTNTE